MDYVTAPGVDIYSAIPDGNYAFYSGTSMATPHVAGVAALLKSHDNSLTSESIEDLIIGTASNLTRDNNISKEELIINSNRKQVITLDTLDNLQLLQNNSRLIGSLNGNMAKRKSTIKDLKKNNFNNGEIGQFEVVSSTRKNFVTIDLSGSDVMASSQILEDWLDSDQFNYFEIDTQMNMI